MRDGAVVAVLRAASWRQAATAVVGDREWRFGRRAGEFVGRWATEPEDAVRLRALRTSFWKNTWAAELEGRPVEIAAVSMWQSTHRILSGGRQVAESGSTGGWSPLSADDSPPLHQQVFLRWMELVLHRRDTAAIDAATPVAVIGGNS
ncbi:hypothetical protein [Blastococcus capsensis]|uniref:hypothetical protein n=1 Tax=Blastococcus capsensis TaxID=1564163 RepID=UPI00253FA863|nr:hypothetical protein [Blastococcus capsensis]MDK3258683.1 hypothetical protein [Blastococcus capsensis]